MNRFVHFEYRDKPLPLNIDKQTQQVLSLDEALEPVLSQFDHLKPFIEKAKELHHRPAEGSLTDDEAAAIYLYTDNCEGQSLPDALNRALQSGNEDLIKPWVNFLKLFHNALEKLPSVKRTLWRGLPIDMIKRLKENDQVVCWGITSCSTSADVVQNILGPNSMLCSIEPLNGKNIHAYSSLSADHEVLLLPNTCLSVKTKGLNIGGNTPRICFEEISDINDEPTSPMDVPMASPHESSNEDEVDADEHHQTTIDAVITFVNGDRYSFKYDSEKRRTCRRYESIDGVTYTDALADKKATGEGIYVSQNGDRFIGTFKDGLRNGHGLLHEIDGSIKVGLWHNDKPTKEDLTKLSHGTVFQWKDQSDKERWYGVYDDGKGNMYIGNILDGKAEQLGIRYWSNGNRYEGFFQNDQKHGYGIYYYSEKDRYAGQWMNDEIEGCGTLFWSSGAIYKGDFINGERSGKGRLVFADGKIQEGKWGNNRYLDEMIH